MFGPRSTARPSYSVRPAPEAPSGWNTAWALSSLVVSMLLVVTQACSFAGAGAGAAAVAAWAAVARVAGAADGVANTAGAAVSRAREIARRSDIGLLQGKSGEHGRARVTGPRPEVTTLI